MHLEKLLSTIMSCVLLVCGNSFACDKVLGTGFCWPLDRQYTRISTPFLEKGSDHGGTYFRGEYHIGVDIAAPEGSTVWPVADGTVISRSEGQPGSGHDSGWTNGSTANYALLVRHTLTDGSQFIALYGHLIVPSKKWKKGDKVHINQPIGKVGDWRFGDHLHLSIWPNRSTVPGGNYGKDIWAHYPNTYGQTDPITFLKNNAPYVDLSDDSKPKELNVRKVDQYAWYPPNVDCQDAEVWFEILSDRCILRDISICQKIQGTCSAQE